MNSDGEIIKLPDGSAFTVLSFPIPKDHWSVKEGFNEAPEPLESWTPELKIKVIEATKYAVRGATANGTISDFDPDALLQNLIYALFRGEK